ncbi:MAG: hypothetical protein D6820_11115, partial [Lentisphaerae bacterium]
DQNRFMLPPWQMRAEQVEQQSTHASVLKRVLLSTCPQALDHWFSPWRLYAARAELHDDGTIRLKHTVLQIAGIPVLYFPWLRVDRDWFEGLEFQQGRTSEWGHWVRIGRRFYVIPKRWRMRVFGESRSKRGYAVGLENRLQTTAFSGRLLTYWMKDHEPLSDYTAPDGKEYNARQETRSLDRYRIAGSWRYRLRESTEGERVSSDELWGQVDLQSDNDIYYEFFRDQYNRDPEPATYLDWEHIAYEDGNGGFSGLDWSVNLRPRVQSFNTVVERLPELRFALPAQAILPALPQLQYASRNTLGNYRMKFREYDLPRFDGSPDNSMYESARFDSIHMFYLPIQWGPLRLVPRVGGRFTWYNNSSANPVNEAQLNAMIAADNRRDQATNTAATSPYDSLGGTRRRWAVESGVELSLPVWSSMPWVSIPFLDINGLYQQFIPSINYTRIPKPNVEREYLYYFDATDRLEENHFVRLELDSYWQTLNFARQRRQLLRTSVYCDLLVDPVDSASHRGDLGWRGELNLAPWLGFNWRNLFNSDSFKLNSADLALRLGTTSSANITLSYFHQRSFSPHYVQSFGTELWQVMGSGDLPITYSPAEFINLAGYLPLGLKTSLSGRYSYDLEKEQFANASVILDHRFECWGIAVGYMEDTENRSIMFSVYLTAFPEKTRIHYGQQLKDKTIDE